MPKILPLLSAILLAGCGLQTTAIINSSTFAQENIYQGYPCRDHCADFKTGYDQAKNGQYQNTTQCTGNDNQVLGCKAYITDYTYATHPDLGLRQEFFNHTSD